MASAPVAPVEAPVEEEPATDADLPRIELSPEVLYDTLVGEIAGQRGQLELATDSLLRAAQATRDPRLAERATNVALYARRYVQALAAAELWQELRPAEDGPVAARGTALVALGDSDGARCAFAELIGRAGTDTAEVYRQIADLLSRHSESPAVAVMDALVEMHPDDPEAHYARAYLADRLNDSAGVLQSIEKALALRPDWEDAALVRMDTLGRSGRAGESAAFAQEFLTAHPRARRVRIQLARQMVDAGEREGALQQFREVARQYPDDAEVAMAIGLLAIQLEQYDLAAETFRGLVQLQPDNDQARLYFGQVEIERGNYDSAEQWLRSVGDAELWFDAQLAVASAIARRGDVDGALVHLQSITPADEGQQIRLYLRQEEVLRQAKRLADAKRLLDQALAGYPDNGDLLYARGLVSAQLRLVQEHERDLRQLIARDPDNAHALNALGYTLADQTTRYQEALDLIERALALEPEDPFILDSMGWVQYRLGDHARALDYLQRALARRDDAEIAAHLGEVLWVSGDRARAEEIWRRALDDDPDNDVLRETVDRFLQ